MNFDQLRRRVERAERLVQGRADDTQVHWHTLRRVWRVRVRPSSSADPTRSHVRTWRGSSWTARMASGPLRRSSRSRPLTPSLRKSGMSSAGAISSIFGSSAT